MNKILVTGASGYVGSSVIRQLEAQGIEVAGCARDSARALARVRVGTEIRVADYDDVSTLATSFQGVDTLLAVPSDGYGKSVLRHMRNVIEAATAAAVGRLVFLSIVDVTPYSPFYYSPVYRQAESWISASGLRWTILRSGLYSDFIRDAWLSPAVASGVLSLPAGDARVAPISRDDVALAAARAVVSDLSGEVLNLTGSEALTFEEIARLFSQANEVCLRYEPIQPADYLLRLWDEAEDPWPHAFASLVASICQGRFADVSPDFQNLAGRPPLSFGDYLNHKNAPCRSTVGGNPDP